MKTVKDIAQQLPIEWSGQIVITTAQLAQVYGTTARNVTHNFNRNKERFEVGKHYFVLQGEELKEFMRVMPERHLPPSTSIAYLWTRRGASRHCKILGTDKAWEQFDYLEENYFDRAQTLKLPQTTMELLELHYKALKEVDARVNNVSTEVGNVRKELESFKNDMPILGIEENKITTAVKKLGVKILGGKESNAYKDRSLRSKLYSDIHRELKRQFGVTTYKAIKRSQCDTALSVIKSYKPPLTLATQIGNRNAQMNMEVD